ncbi:phosphoketolase family protein [bacterium]|nr:phosphoketolase family protein [bacterium]
MSKISEDRIQQLNTYWRAANYLGAAQIYLRKNTLLKEPLKPEHIKPRLLGHWGTQPGLNIVYAHLDRLIQDTDANILLVVGPGHGGPGILASLFLEHTMTDYYPEISYNAAGIDQLIRRFSWPYGAPSHLVPQTPGVINIGGELGYSLLHAYGAAMDNPDLIVACVVGDGEAETGPAAASWMSNKFLNPVTSGAVLPILDLNGYKLSAPTIYARTSNEDLEKLFSGLGYQVRVVEGDDPFAVHTSLWETLDWAYDQIKNIQQEARSGKDVGVPRWPMIALRTPKGWGCPKTLDGKPLENTFHAHQVPITDPATNPDHLDLLENWLRNYRPEDLFDKDGVPIPEATKICPKGDKRMGANPHANGGKLRVPLKLPEFSNYAVDVSAPGQVKAEATRTLGKYVRDIFKANAGANNFRMFSPDESTSNRMASVFDVTERAWMQPIIESDEYLARDGRVIEILSEHCCQGWLESYLKTGRYGIFNCYEAFIPIVESMMNQHAKWLKDASETPWRAPIASLNYLLTSHVWRQDHNGYSHQVPSFISNVATKRGSMARIYLPPDANSLLAVMDNCFNSLGMINLVVSCKQPELQWLDIDEAKDHCEKGIGIWDWASNDQGEPDIVLAAAGDIPTTEILAAAWLLGQEVPDMKVRVVNVVDLFTLMTHNEHPHGLDDHEFNRIFTSDKPVIFSFHGYPSLVHELIHRHANPHRFHVHGYIEEGRTTTPFDMLVLNENDRYHLAIDAIQRVPRFRHKAGTAVSRFNSELNKHKSYIYENDEDMPEITDWKWSDERPKPVAAAVKHTAGGESDENTGSEHVQSI